MKEFILELVNQYALLGVIGFLFLAFAMLWRIYRQMKQLNHNLDGITGNMQKYFAVILEEEPLQEVVQKPAEESFLTKEEKEMLLSDRGRIHQGDEKIFNEVMQEYFS